jgi:hypothetical protein
VTEDGESNVKCWTYYGVGSVVSTAHSVWSLFSYDIPRGSHFVHEAIIPVYVLLVAQKKVHTNQERPGVLVVASATSPALVGSSPL